MYVKRYAHYVNVLVFHMYEMVHANKKQFFFFIQFHISQNVDEVIIFTIDHYNGWKNTLNRQIDIENYTHKQTQTSLSHPAAEENENYSSKYGNQIVYKYCYCRH